MKEEKCIWCGKPFTGFRHASCQRREYFRLRKEVGSEAVRQLTEDPGYERGFTPHDFRLAFLKVERSWGVTVQTHRHKFLEWSDRSRRFLNNLVKKGFLEARSHGHTTLYKKKEVK